MKIRNKHDTLDSADAQHCVNLLMLNNVNLLFLWRRLLLTGHFLQTEILPQGFYGTHTPDCLLGQEPYRLSESWVKYGIAGLDFRPLDCLR